MARGTRKATGATTTAKSCRLLKAIMQTAVEDEVIRQNPRAVRGAGRGDADERPVATVEEVFAFAGIIGIRWRLMVLLGAFASLRQRSSPSCAEPTSTSTPARYGVRRAAPELDTGPKGVIGDPKPRAGKREIVLPAFPWSARAAGPRSGPS